MRIVIPGEPVAQGRPKFSAYKIKTAHGKEFTRVSARDPKKSRSWKGAAQVHMVNAGAVPLTGPVRLRIKAVFSLPKGQHRKRIPRPAQMHTKRPDLDNVIKCVKDAASGILYFDDSQVCVIWAQKWVGAQGEAPCVVIDVDPA